VIGTGWVDSGLLKPGMRIEAFDRGALVVESLVAKNVNEVTYNFTVGDFHTYFVGGQRALVHNCNRACTGTLYHYTDAKGAAQIESTGTILPDARGRIFLTPDRVSASEASDVLFMGRGGSKGTHVVEVNVSNGTTLLDGTQPNEIIIKGALRNGRNAELTVKPND